MMEVALTFHGERKDSLVHGLGKTGSVYRGKNKKNWILTEHHIQRWIKDPNVKDKTMRLLEKSRSEYC